MCQMYWETQYILLLLCLCPPLSSVPVHFPPEEVLQIAESTSYQHLSMLLSESQNMTALCWSPCW